MTKIKVVTLKAIADQFKEVDTKATIVLDSTPEDRAKALGALEWHRMRLDNLLRSWLTKEGLI